MVAAEDVDLSAVKYEQEEIKGQSANSNTRTHMIITNYEFIDEFIDCCWVWWFGLCWVFGLAAPHLTGLIFKLSVRIVEAPIVGSFIVSAMKKQNKMTQVFQNSVLLSFLVIQLLVEMFYCVRDFRFELEEAENKLSVIAIHSCWGIHWYQRDPCSNLNFPLKVFWVWFLLIWVSKGFIFCCTPLF